jgi:hypothetical protein
MSFDLKPIIYLDNVLGFFISAPKFGLTNYDLLGSLVVTPPTKTEKKNFDLLGTPPTKTEKKYLSFEGTEPSLSGGAIMMSAVGTTGQNRELPCIVFPIYLEKCLPNKEEPDSSICEPTRLPSIQSPDICDYKVSPLSFVTLTALKLSNDCCEVLLPSSLPIQQYRFYRVIVRLDDANTPNVAANTTALSKQVDVFGIFTPNVAANEVDVSVALPSPAKVIKFGEILEYQQDWYSLGHSLGEIKYSLPLAPGESTQLAVIEWSRSDLASRTDNILATEFLDHDLRRDRAIKDTVDAALNEEQGGNSHFGGTSGTASGQTYGSGMWTGNHAFGGGISYSYGNRDLEGKSLQDIHDRVRQASSSVRSLNSTVIVQGSQAESSTLQTRRVANHNHCHALTIQYYEVLRHYRMTTKFSGRRQAVLIPFKPFAFTSTSWEIALRFRTVLEQTLLDPSLKKCFEALIRLNLSPSVYEIPKQSVGPGTTGSEITEVEEAVTVTGDKEPGVKSGIKVRKDDNFTMNAAGLLIVDSGGQHGQGGFGPGGDSTTAPSGGNYPFIAPGLLAWSLIYKIGLIDEWHQGPTTSGASKEFTADRDGEIILNVNSMQSRFANFKDTAWTVNLKYPSHEEAPTPKDESKDDSKDPFFRKSDDELCSARLLRHLQDNQGYYNSAVWMLMDSVERRLYLEAALATRSDILAGMDDRPLAISGNYVAFQYNGPLNQFDNSRADDPIVPFEDIVTLPTRGFFAEAQMGHCNSCEKRDVTRNSDWTEMITETPPEISGITPGPKGTAPSITPGQLPSNVIQITQPQAAPDPTALANALGVLKTPNIFRDMAGLSEVTALVGRMVEAATDANIKAMGAQAQARIAELQANAKKGSGSGGGSTSSGASGPSATDLADRLSLLPEIKTFAKDIGLDSGELKNFALDQVYGQSRPGSSAPTGQGTAEGIPAGQLEASADAGVAPDVDGERPTPAVMAGVNADSRLKESLDKLLADGWDIRRTNIYFGNSSVNSTRRVIYIDDDDEPVATTTEWIADAVRKAYQRNDDYRRKAIRDKAMSIFGAAGSTDVEKMANTYEWAAWFWRYPTDNGNASGLMDDMMLVLTELEPDGLRTNDQSYRIFGPGRLPTSYAGSTGFKYAFRDDSNQVRHATASLQASFVGGLAGYEVMQTREASDSADWRLNSRCYDIASGMSVQLSPYVPKTLGNVLRNQLGDPAQTGAWTGPVDGDPNAPMP